MADADGLWRGLTVGRLREALAGLDGGMEIVVRDASDDGEFCGGVLHVGVEHAHDEDGAPFLAIDCSDDEDDFEDVDGGPDSGVASRTEPSDA